MKQPGDDMDELFQRAGTDYPLKSTESDWDAISMRLQQVPVLPVRERSNNKKVFITGSLLIIVMLAGLVTMLTIGKKNNGKFSELSVNTESNQIIRNKLKSLPVPGFNKVILKGNLPATDVVTRKTISPDKMDLTIVMPGKVKENAAGSRINWLKPINSINAKAATFSKPDISKIKPVIPDYQLINLVPKFKNRSGIYAGFAAGPQLNEVKRQGMKKAGIDLGIITGYQFTRSLSIETGLFFSHKTYFSAGKYFQMKTADPAMPSGMEVLSLEGSSSVLEVPLKLKYNFSQKSRSNLFSSIGASSYIMTKEKNNYNAMMNGAPQQMEGNYKTANRYLAAAVNLSAGYEYKPGNKHTIRVEPYIQIPIRGIGVGSIPITSAGVHIGVIWNQ